MSLSKFQKNEAQKKKLLRKETNKHTNRQTKKTI